MDDNTVYLACLDFIATVYNNVDFTNHPDLTNTMRILDNIVLNTGELGSYIYMKGLQEGIICSEKGKAT